MKIRHRYITPVIAVASICLGALLAVSCSSESNPAMYSAGDEENVQPIIGKPYPALTPEKLAEGPAPGYRFFMLTEGVRGALDDPPSDTLRGSERCERRHGKTVKISHLVEIKIERDLVPQDTVVSIIAPLGFQPVADFYPHPLQFEGMVEIKWKIKDLNLPNDFDYTTLEPFYVNDDGEYEPVEYEWRHGWDELIVRTDHFSRYIVGQRIR